MTKRKRAKPRLFGEATRKALFPAYKPAKRPKGQKAVGLTTQMPWGDLIFGAAAVSMFSSLAKK